MAEIFVNIGSRNRPIGRNSTKMSNSIQIISLKENNLKVPPAKLSVILLRYLCVNTQELVLKDSVILDKLERPFWEYPPQ